MMIVVVIIGVLATIAVNSYHKYMSSARRTEVYTMFGELRAKQEAYRAEFSQYVSTGGSESNFWPILGGGEPSSRTRSP